MIDRNCPDDATKGRQLSGKTVIITGGSGQIGYQLALACACQDASVIVTCRTQEKAAEVAMSIKEKSESTSIYGLPLQLISKTGMRQFVKVLDRMDLHPDALINSARSTETLETEDGIPSWENWLEEYAIDVVSPYHLTMALKEELARSGRGSVVNISSIYGIVAVNPNIYPDPTWVSPIHYSAAKAAQIHVTRELAVRLAPFKIRINSITYGGVGGRLDDEFMQRYSAMCPMKRMLQPGDLGAAVVFLSSDGASGITGHNLVVDGGWSIW